MNDPELLTDRERPAIRVERRYEHPIDRVWRAVTAAEHLAQWFPAAAEIDLRPGGPVRFDGFEDDAASGRVLEVDPPRYLSFTWGDDRLEFELHERDGRTDFVLTHHFDDRAGAASFATGWETCLAGLGEVLAGAEPGEPGRSVERHEELVARFRLDRPEVTRGGTGWHVRFERQLTCPAETAWDLFFGSDPAGGERRRAPAVGEEFRARETPEVVLGTVTEVDAPRTFAFKVADGEPGDAVRLRLGEGTGHGARLFLEVRGGEEAELDRAVDRWGAGAVAHVAREAARLAA
ncbi:SRPBCC domain-containing protein [Glycomyces sp. TRM65418]|uniref:SRPBCC family protein n=1 Tax=Glycomyces sp. TRM65418 TaxID=2867006 RepID=UPI001CE6CA8E|nr:SRPBCC family protein [Glycomyces sp. TRM65418]MCC3761809.1 SRPBCC domain-containing protein [Glycomyces sp. TRM65418]QZD55892.1 SRPBCC domain-containing protein [Glycomyces sp. TRM65418]